MATVKEFVDKQKAFNDRQAAAIDSAVASASGLNDDITALLAKIKALQDSAGQVTPEDQALIDAIETQSDAIATKSENLATALQTLDAQNPPVVPNPA